MHNLLRNLLLVIALLGTTLSAQNADVTTNLLAYFTDLLEQNTLEDKDLLKLIACAKEQKTCNPIDACEADISTVHSVAFRVINSLLEDKIDSARVLAWAKKNLKVQEETRKEQKQTQTDTKSLFGNIKYSSLALGNRHSCAIKANGTVVCWGENSEGQTEVPAALGEVLQIAAGHEHSCAIKADGRVICWGQNYYRQIEVPEELLQVKTLTCGQYHTCALLFDGAVNCWGHGSFGELSVPLGLGDASDIAAFGSTSCALQYNGKVACWGDEDFKTDLQAALRPGSTEVVGVSHKCSLSKAGEMRCWGHNSGGVTDVPENLGEVLEIELGFQRTCAVLANGSVRCWGINLYGRNDIPEGLRVRLPASGSTP